jgi:hypothetical protein
MNPNDELIIYEQSKYTLDDFKDWYLNWNNWLHDSVNSVNSVKNEYKLVKVVNL